MEVIQHVSHDDPRPAIDYYGAQISMPNGIPTLAVISEALHEFKIARVPPDAIVQWSGNLITATWRRESAQ